MDFINDGAKIRIGDEAKAKLIETMTADVEFLTKNDIMDYSLLLGIHDTKRVMIYILFVFFDEILFKLSMT